MTFPLYLYYEMLVRVREFLPNVGEYQFVLVSEDSVIISTTIGKLKVSNDLLSTQFKDPDIISTIQIQLLASQFCMQPDPCMFA
jgi:hypothetical protein